MKHWEDFRDWHVAIYMVALGTLSRQLGRIPHITKRPVLRTLAIVQFDRHITLYPRSEHWSKRNES